MARHKIIAPSILSADFANLGKAIEDVTQAGADWIHVDVMDGHFVNNITIGIPVVAALKKISRIPLDVHLMIDKPEKYVEQFVNAGADYLTIHCESTADIPAVLTQIRQLGCRPGITLRPGTPIGAILPYLKRVDLALVMSVEPGFGGQGFMEDQVVKIQRLRKEIDDQSLPCLLEVDGGVNEQTVARLGDADVLVAGSYIFNNDYRLAIKTLREA